MDISQATALELTVRNAYAVIGGRRWKTAKRVVDNLPESRTTNGPKSPEELTDHQMYIIAESFKRFDSRDVTPKQDAKEEGHLRISVTLPASLVKSLRREAQRTGEKLSRIVALKLQ